MDNYLIEHADKSKADLQVKYKSENADSSVILPGKYSIDYGRDLNSTLLHLMEHFPDSDPPLGQQHGQLWYNTRTNKLNVLTNETWKPLGYTRPPTIPKDALSGNKVSEIPTSYLSIDGGVMQGPLVIKDTVDTDSEHSAVNKQFVDLLIPPIPSDYIPLKGNTSPAGPIIMNGPESSELLSVITRKYADDNIPQMHTVSRDVSILTIDGVKNGYYNCVVETPSNMCYVFGVVYLKSGDSITQIKLNVLSGMKFTNGVAVTCNFVGPHAISTTDATPTKIYCDVDVYYDSTTGPQVLKFIKHNIERDGSAHFTVIGRLS